MQIYDLEQIKKKVNILKMISMQEQGFILFSKGIANIPMPGFIEHKNPKGSYHIKYGHIEGEKYWVVKIAGGPDSLPINGIMVAININNGEVEYILQDQGYLTSLRTAIAGLIAAKFLANKDIKAIGIIGTGIQARMQLELLKYFTDCKKVYVWGRSKDKLQIYKNDMEKKGFDIIIASDVSMITKNCNLIVTTTPSEKPIIKVDDVIPGTHINAIGADSPGKSELDPKLIAKSDVLVVDSKKQCIDHGEVAKAYQKKLITVDNLIELGEIINRSFLGRINEDQITIADLTGLAIQDIQIVKSILLEA